MHSGKETVGDSVRVFLVSLVCVLSPMHGIRLSGGLSISGAASIILCGWVLLGRAGLTQQRLGSSVRWLNFATRGMVTGLAVASVSTASLSPLLVVHAVTMMTVAVIARTSEKSTLFLLSYITGSLVSVGVGHYQFLVQDTVRASGLAGRPNELAISSALGIAGLLLLLRSAKVPPLPATGAAVVLASAIVAAGSRTGFVMVVAIAIFHLATIAQVKNLKRVLAIAAVATIAATLPSERLLEVQNIQRFLGDSTTQASDFGREQLNTKARTIAIDSIPFGGAYTTDERSHNALVKVSIHAGLLGAFFFFFFGAAVLVKASWLAISGRPGPYGSASFFVICWVTTTVWDPLLWIFVVCELQLVESLNPSHRAKNSTKPVNPGQAFETGTVTLVPAGVLSKTTCRNSPKSS